jgi:arylsulfatase A-like enzyme
MRTKRASAVALILSMSCLAFAAQAQQLGPNASRPPNILLVIADDIGMDVTTDMYPGLIDGLVSRYGPSGLDHPDFQAIHGRPASTPNLDRLAKQGMRFTHAWAHPFCSPTRAAVITGLFAAETKVTSYEDALSPNHTTFVQLLRDKGGYSTAIFGKWHLAGLPGNPSYPGVKPKQAGFDLFRGNLHAAIGTYWDYDYQVQLADTPADQWLEQSPPVRSLPGIAPTTYAPVVKVADTIEWITEREEADADRPWFAWLAFNLSHATIQRAPSQMAVPNADTLDAATAAAVRECGGVFGTPDYGSCPGELQMRAMTNSLDTLLGKLLEAVDALDRNTYVILIGDNGTPMYGRPNLDFIDNMYITRSGRGKGTVFESGARVPMVIRGPGIEPNSESAAIVHVVDLYATALELAGLQVPDRVSNSEGNGTVPLAGMSLAPIVFGKASSVRDPDKGYLLTETHDLMRGGIREVGARNLTHKVLCTDGAAAANCEFYDLEQDPLEEYPLAKPDDCAGYTDGSWTPADPEWHFCRLTDVVARKSFLIAKPDGPTQSW